MTLEAVQRSLELSDFEPGFLRGWPDSERSFPSSPLPFATGEFIRSTAPLTGLPDEAVDRLCRVAEGVRRTPELAHLLWHEHRIITGLDTPPPGSRRPFHRHSTPPGVPFLDEEFSPSGFPELTTALGSDAPTLNLLVALSVVPHTVAFYETRRIPQGVLRETLSDFAVWYRYYTDRLGVHGINLGTLSWLRFHLTGRLFRLGRLQFMQGAFPRDLSVYRSRRTAELQVLAAPGLSVDASGLLVFDPAEAGVGESWETMRTALAGTIRGNPIDPSGQISREPIALDLDEYEVVLEENTPVMEIHIPEGGNLSPEACADSFARAEAFLPHYFPEREFVAFTCESWFLGRDLLDLLPPTSNMAKFAHALHLYPCIGGEEDVLARVFGPRYRELGSDRWERRSTLQRRLAGWVDRGGHPREGGGFLLRDEIPHEV